MSMRTSEPTCCSSSASGMPFRGSLGSATITGICDKSSSIVKAYSASGSARTRRRSSASRDDPRIAIRYSTTTSSAAMMPVKAPASTAMLVSVARSPRDSAAKAGPSNSSTLPTAPPSLISGRASRYSMTSLAHTPAPSAPFRTTWTLCGTSTRTSRVSQALAMSVLPTPNAKQPSTPAMHVCESVPITSSPGSAKSSITLLWQMASLPAALPSRSTSPNRRTPWRFANACCTVTSSRDCSTKPSFLCCSGITLSRNVRWSRNRTNESGSATRVSSPKPARKSASAMGVTYSWLKRRSARAKSASPGATAARPSTSRAASRTVCVAKIFSASVIGRTGRAGSSGACAPLSRARLYANSPPASTIAREMADSCAENWDSSRASPCSSRSSREKSVLVSKPMFWQFCR